MSSPELKQEFSMEAGLLSTREEERMMSKEALLPQDERPIQPRARRTSPARRAAIAFAAVCLLGLGLVSVGGAPRMSMMCPGHLRHGSGQEVESSVAAGALNLTKDAVFQSLQVPESLAKRQATSPNQTETPVATPSNTPSQTPAETPSETPSNTMPNTPATTSQPPVEPTTSIPLPDTTTNPVSSAPPPETTTRAPTTSERAATSSEQLPETSSSPAAPTSIPATSNPATSNPATSNPATTSRAPGNTSRQPSSSASPDDKKTSTEEKASRTPTQSTIYSGTKTTSKPVPKTLTSTLPNGGVTTLTSTSWVAIVPSAESTAGGNPDLQNSAPRLSSGTTLSILAGAVLGGMLLM